MGHNRSVNLPPGRLLDAFRCFWRGESLPLSEAFPGPSCCDCGAGILYSKRKIIAMNRSILNHIKPTTPNTNSNNGNTETGNVSDSGEITNDKTPHGLKPYVSLGMDLEIKDNHGVGECPFCDKANKFSVDCETSQWKCWSCGGGTESGGGNALSFIRLLYNASVERTEESFYVEVAQEKRLLSQETVKKWGVCKSVIPPCSWLVPGFGTDGKLNQLYRRCKVKDSNNEWVWRLLPTPGIWPEGKSHHFHVVQTHFDPNRSRSGVVFTEGIWDGMALSEVALDNELGISDLIALPGCNVWRDEWTAMCKDRDITIIFDSDHPRQKGIRTQIAGYDGVVRIAKRLSGIARTVSWLRWGVGGWNAEKPDGWDLRDALSGMPDEPLPLEDRKAILYGLIRMIEPALGEWFSGTSPRSVITGRDYSIESRPCNTWKECEAAWDSSKGGTLLWREDLSYTLATILAVCASTQQSGNQLFMDIVGSPGSAKTTILEGTLVSKQCVQVENLTKIISGWKKKDDNEVDCSFLARNNNKTWVTCEFDTILGSPQYAELMGKIRRVFDGKTSATFGNDDKDRHYFGLRTPWIRAGTWKMMFQDQSQLGDRFLRIIINDPTEKDKRDIMRSALRSERSAMVKTSNGTAGGIVDDKTRKAYSLTGGYIDWLRANIEEKIQVVESNIKDWVEDVCMDLAEFSADMRARPNIPNKWKKESFEIEGHKELPTRLGRQNIRLAAHLAVVLNKKEIDSSVLKIVRKVALDTANGHSLNVANWLCTRNPDDKDRSYQETGGLSQLVLEKWCNMDSARMENYLMFLRKIGVVDLIRGKGGVTWVLTDRTHHLYLGLMGELKGE